MDENEDVVVEIADSTDAVDAAWADDDYTTPAPSTDVTETEAEADQAETEVEETDETPTTAAETKTEKETPETESGADEYLELKHMDDPVRKVTKAEAQELAQKGLDYDRIRGKLDSATQENAQLKGYKDFLEEIKGNFPTIEDLMADTKAAMYIQEQKKKGNTITKASALEYVKSQMAKAPAHTEPTPSAESVAEAIKRDSFTRFAEAYPSVKAKEIPKEVWDDVEKTNSLVASYAKWELKQTKEELENLKLENKNRARSAGSMKSKGSSPESIIDKYWNADDDF